MTACFVVVASLLAVALPVRWADRQQRALTPKQGDSALDLARLQALGREYGITIVTNGERFPVDLTTGWIGGADADQQSLAAYQELLQTELRIYPLSLAAWLGLRRVVLCRDLTLSGRRRGCIVAAEIGSLYVDVLLSASTPGCQEWCLHHELYHWLDALDDGSQVSDPAWQSLNPPAFRYTGLEAYRWPSRAVRPKSAPGFATLYAATALEEDKAEIFAMLLAAPRELARRAESDRVLQAKVDLLKLELSRLSVGFDSAFWHRTEEYRDSHHIGSPYWLPE